MFYLLENAIALFLALLVNVAIVALSAAICVDNLSADTNTCSTLTLKSAFILFKVNLAETQLYIYIIGLTFEKYHARFVVVIPIA